MSARPSSPAISTTRPINETWVYQPDSSSTVRVRRGSRRRCRRRTRVSSMFSRTRSSSSRRYHVATDTGWPSERRVATTAGFGLASRARTSSGKGSSGMVLLLRGWPGSSRANLPAGLATAGSVGPMRAVVYTETGPSSVLRLVERDVPEPGPGEVRVRVVRAGVNPTDWKSRAGGSMPMAFAEVTPGQDGAGVVDALGADVPGLAPGDRVWLYLGQYGLPHGTAAEYCVLDWRRVVRLPDVP